jgi:hypothetical protein
MRKNYLLLLVCSLSYISGFSNGSKETQNLSLKMYDAKNIFQPKNDWWDKYSSGLIAGITVVISLSISIVQARASKKHNKELVISEARIDWIQNLRPKMSKIVSLAGKIKFHVNNFTAEFYDVKKQHLTQKALSKEETIQIEIEYKEILNIVFEFSQIFNEIKLFLNFEKEAHKKFNDLIDEYIRSILALEKLTLITELHEVEILNSARVILKEAWDEANAKKKK